MCLHLWVVGVLCLHLWVGGFVVLSQRLRRRSRLLVGRSHRETDSRPRRSAYARPSPYLTLTLVFSSLSLLPFYLTLTLVFSSLSLLSFYLILTLVFSSLSLLCFFTADPSLLLTSLHETFSSSDCLSLNPASLSTRVCMCTHVYIVFACVCIVLNSALHACLRLTPHTRVHVHVCCLCTD